MEKQGYVSLWVGNIESKKEFYEYVEIVYNDDGDAFPSIFLNDFQINIDDFDEDSIECIFSKNKTQSLAKIIKNCSYEDTVLLEYKKMIGNFFSEKINVAVLLYDFQYDGRIVTINNNNHYLKFIGAVKYI